LVKTICVSKVTLICFFCAKYKDNGARVSKKIICFEIKRERELIRKDNNALGGFR